MRTIIVLSLALAAIGCDRGRERDERRGAPHANIDHEKQVEEREEEEAVPAADNTRRNARDRDGGALTPGDQGESDSDRAITMAIRRMVVADDDLTVTAKNVKIITRDAVVTLRGPVRSDAERATIERHARAAAGVKEVDNQLEVAPGD
jgi:osmotically-inducible protein OsmY